MAKKQIEGVESDSASAVSTAPAKHTITLTFDQRDLHVYEALVKRADSERRTVAVQTLIHLLKTADSI